MNNVLSCKFYKSYKLDKRDKKNYFPSKYLASQFPPKNV